ncbi:ABC transporter ATP-binding protein [Glaciibacter superstes]|uniref:ABC transporter ATP-binding protein n=1 Tax=Glaciibacter superstes TaxID=501023 RepID=UPI0003B62920|nr:ABC transporter ATP-binding protein [Glaciibacter superstes]
MKSISEPKTTTVQLDIRDIHARVGGQHVLQGLSLTVEEGEFLTVLGHNGAGKSTLLRTVMGLVRAREGSLSFSGADITKLSTPQVVNSGISLVPQQRGYFENLSVGDNLDLAATDGRIDIGTIHELFPALAEREKQLVGTMSGGQRQMVALSIALLANPKLLMLDEPSVGLQPNLVERVMEVTDQINREYGITIIMVEQNIEKALRVAHRVAVVNRGRIALNKSTADVNPQEIWDLL